MGQIEILKLDFKQLTNIVVASDEYSRHTLILEGKLHKKNEKTVKIFDSNFVQTAKYSQKEKEIETNLNFNCEEEKLERLLNKRIIKCVEHYKEIIT